MDPSFLLLFRKQYKRHARHNQMFPVTKEVTLCDRCLHVGHWQRYALLMDVECSIVFSTSLHHVLKIQRTSALPHPAPLVIQHCVVHRIWMIVKSPGKYGDGSIGEESRPFPPSKLRLASAGTSSFFQDLGSWYHLSLLEIRRTRR